MHRKFGLTPSLGLGLTNTFTGLVVAAFQAVFHDSIDAGLPVIITGRVVTLASIPVLIRAYQFRSKAKKLALSIGVTRLHSSNVPTSVAKPATAPALSPGRDLLTFGLHFFEKIILWY